MSEQQGFVVFDHVSKVYRTGDVEIHAVRDVTFSLQKGEFGGRQSGE